MSIKILWFSNISILKGTLNKSGTWISSMYSNLHKEETVKIIGNVTISSNTSPDELSINGFQEYYIPTKWINYKGFANSKFSKKIEDIIFKLKPDIIHIWGTELPFADVIYKIDQPAPCLIDIQGLLGVISLTQYYNAGIEKLPNNILGELEWLCPSFSLKYQKKKFAMLGKKEQEILSKYNYIATQSEWVRNNLYYRYGIHKNFYKSKIILRDSFYNSNIWSVEHRYNRSPIVFVLASPNIYKGIHVVIEAILFLKAKYPDIKLRIAGINYNRKLLMVSGYLAFINKLIISRNLQKNVEFIGNIKEDVIIQELYNCDVFVNPSFVETFCLALAEALAIGVPTVSSSAAALPELIEDGKSGFLFSPGDSASCAAKIDRLFSDKKLSFAFCENASDFIRKKLNPLDCAKNQIKIYKEILNNSSLK